MSEHPMDRALQEVKREVAKAAKNLEAKEQLLKDASARRANYITSLLNELIPNSFDLHDDEDGVTSWSRQTALYARWGDKSPKFREVIAFNGTSLVYEFDNRREVVMDTVEEMEFFLNNIL